MVFWDLPSFAPLIYSRLFVVKVNGGGKTLRKTKKSKTGRAYIRKRPMFGPVVNLWLVGPFPHASTINL